MLELVFHPYLRILPSAKCPKHPNEDIGAVSAWTEGRVIVEWKCPVCESEAKKQMDEVVAEPLQVFPIGARRTILLE